MILRWLISFILMVSISLCSWAAAPHYQKAFYTITLNNYSHLPVQLVLQHQQDIYLTVQTIKQLGLQVPNNIPTVIQGQNTYYPLYALPHVHYKINPSQGNIAINADAHAFTAQIYDSDSDGDPSTIATPVTQSGLFLNYDLFTEQSGQNNNQISGNIENGLFTPYGVGINNILVRNNLNQQNNRKKFSAIRLTTSWRKDFPNTMQTLNLGDGITHPGLWGSSLSFGGIQFGTNFSTRPYFDSYPLPSAQGLASIPSEVDILVNNQLRQRQGIDSGPFVIDNLPVITGGGNVQLVIRDALGRLQVLDVPYYSSTSLLRKGLDDFSFSAGWLRRDFAIDSFNYRHLVGEMNFASGITNRLTIDMHGEFSSPIQTIGAGINTLLGYFGTLTAATALSHKHALGELALLRFTRQIDSFNIGISSQYTTSRFQKLTSIDGQLPPEWQNQVFTGFSFPHSWGSLGLSFTQQISREQQQNNATSDTNFFSINYSNSIFHRISYNISATTSLYGKRNQSIYLFVTIPLSHDTYANASTNWQHQQGAQATIGLQKTTPYDHGWGYNLRASEGKHDNRFISASGTYQTAIGRYQLSVAQQRNDTSYQASIDGGMVWFADYFGLTPKVNQSFAIVKANNAIKVPVYWENRQVAVTNRYGEAIIPNLFAYDKNRISLNPKKLPLTMQFDQLEKSVVPYYRSGVLVKFQTKIVQPATLTIVLDNGKPLPVDASVTNPDTQQSYLVGYNGQVYLPDSSQVSQLSVTVKQLSCTIKLQRSKQPDSAMSRLGTYHCQLSTRG